MTKLRKTYAAAPLGPDESVQLVGLMGELITRPVLVTSEFVELVECDLCGDQIRLGHRRSIQSFLTHRGSNICSKKADQILKRRTNAAQNLVIQEARQALHVFQHLNSSSVPTEQVP
jgi:hypothetical protein